MSAQNRPAAKSAQNAPVCVTWAEYDGKECIEDLLEEYFCDDNKNPYEFSKSQKFGWLVNDSVNSKRGVPTGNELSVSFYSEELKIAICAYAWGRTPSFYKTKADDYGKRIDRMKFEKCIEHHIRLYLLPPCIDDVRATLEEISNDVFKNWMYSEYIYVRDQLHEKSFSAPR